MYGSSDEITVYTDHEDIQGIKDKYIIDVTNNRELRLSQKLKPYKINIQHIPKDNNLFADPLSPLPEKGRKYSP